jgi:DNA-binding MarR family transcriptional regulator
MANKKVIIESDLDLQNKTTSLLFCTVRCYQSQIDKRLRPLNLSMTQLLILDMLERAEANKMNVNEIKGKLADDCPNVSRSLNKLCETGNIVKKRCTKDQRVVYITITAKGCETHQLADQLIKDIHVNLEGEELEQFYHLLLKL